MRLKSGKKRLATRLLNYTDFYFYRHNENPRKDPFTFFFFPSFLSRVLGRDVTFSLGDLPPSPPYPRTRPARVGPARPMKQQAGVTWHGVRPKAARSPEVPAAAGASPPPTVPSRPAPFVVGGKLCVLASESGARKWSDNQLLLTRSDRTIIYVYTQTHMYMHAQML